MIFLAGAGYRTPKGFPRLPHGCLSARGHAQCRHVVIKRGKCSARIQFWPCCARLLAGRVPVEMRFCIEKISVHQTRKKQPYIEHGSDCMRPRVNRKNCGLGEFKSICGCSRLQSFNVCIAEVQARENGGREIGWQQTPQRLLAPSLQANVVTLNCQRCCYRPEFHKRN